MDIKNIKFYCLTTDDNIGIQRYNESEILFKKHNINVEKYVGINGDNLKKDVRYAGNERTYANLLSHFDIIKKAKDQNLEYVGVFEDDVFFCDDYEKRIEYIKNSGIGPDMFYLGGFFNSNTNKFGNTEHEKIKKLIGSGGTHSYIIRNTIYDFILNQFDLAVQHSMAIDGFYARVIGKEPDNRFYFNHNYQILAYLPFLCATRPTFSRLENRNSSNNYTLEHFKSNDQI